MNQSKLRATVASEQLAALVVASATLDEPSDNELLVDHAVALTDLLLAKLNSTTPDKSESLDLGADVVVLGEWSRTERVEPAEQDLCWVVAWDSVMECITSVRPLIWSRSGWEDADGNRLSLSGSHLQSYWQSLYRFGDVDSARTDFIDHLVSSYATQVS